MTRIQCALVVPCLLLAACSTVQRQTPDLKGQDVRLTILHTADIHARLLPYNFVPGRNDSDLGLDPVACKAWACGQIAGITDPATLDATAREAGCRRITITADKVQRIVTSMGLPSADAVSCQVLSGQYTKLCAANTYAGSCVPDGNGGFVTYDCTCNYGGVARLATVLKQERAAAGRALHLDSGDCFEGAPIFNVFMGEAEMRMMSMIGVDAAALGNHEFDKGAANLANQLLNWTTYPTLAANYQFETPDDFSRPWLGTLVRPYTVFNVDGLRVGVIGMGNLSSLQGVYEAGNSLGIVPLATEETVRYYVDLIRPSVDLVVAVSHLGLDEDEDAAVSEAYGSASAPGAQNEQAAVKGMDVILGGHLHITLNPPKLIPQRDDQGNPTGFNTVLVHSGAFAKYVGRLDLAVHVGDNTSTDPSMRDSHVASYTYDLLPIDARIASDGDVLNHLEPYEIKLNETLDLTKTFAFVGTAGEAKILRTDLNGGDSQLGNLVTLSMRVRNRVEADFALTNSLGIRTDFEYGALTLEQMYNVFPFENSITTMFLSGSEVQEMLDFVARKSADRGCRSQAQVSGIAFDMVCRRASGCYDGTLPIHCTVDKDCGDPCYVFCFSDPTSATQTCRKRASPPPAGACAGAALVTNTGDIGNNPFSSACADNIYLGDGCNACVPTDATSSCCDNQNIGGIAHPCKCAPLNPYGTYKVAVNDYIAGGGSGFLVLKRNTTKYNTGIWLRDALVDYLRQGSTRCGTLVGGWNVTTVDGYRDLDSRQWDDATNSCLDAVTGVHTSVPRDQCGLACIDETVEAHDGRITPILE